MKDAHEGAKLVLVSTAAAIAYGLMLDQVTAHLCVEYFSVAHPHVIDSNSPFLLALVWGVLATWWVGLPLGLGLAVAARLGPGRKLGVSDVWPSIVKAMAFTAAAAAISGAIGAALVATGRSDVPLGWGPVIAPAKHAAFSADAYAHLASYGFGAVSGLFVIGWVIWRRVRPMR